MLRSARWSLSVGLLACLAPALSAAENIADSRLANTARYLSSDELAGRGVGEKGIDQAAEFIAAEFKKMGLKTDLIEGAPYQKFTITIEAVQGPPEQNKLTLVGPAKDGKPQQVELTLGQDFTPLAIGGSSVLDAPLVFVGYGITAADLEYDEYANLDVKDKIVIILRKEPQQNNPHSLFDGDKNTPHAFFQNKVANAYEHGAAAVILVNDGQELITQAKKAAEDLKKAIAAISKAVTEFKATEKPSAEAKTKYQQQLVKLAERLQQASTAEASDHDKVLAFAEAGPSASRKTFPVMFATRAAINQLIEASLDTTLDKLEQKIDDDLKPVSTALAGWKAIGEVAVAQHEAEVKNVIAVLPGEGPLADETIVIGAHYDHLGMGGTGSLAPWTKAIHNGADDNASGAAALLETAWRLSQREKKPARRIVFIAFTGEERGLLGSAHYVREPLFPLESTIAMINMDMVGRLSDNKLIIQGFDTAVSFDALLDTINASAKFEVVKKTGGFGPSDHSSFYAKKIPVFHLFTGTHADYHRPTDDFDKLNLEGMDRVVDFVVALTDAIDADPKRPEYVEKKKPEVIARGGSRPYLGSIPDFGVEVEGYALQGVAPGSPADEAGIKAGDVIIKLGASKIGSLEDIDSALRKHKAGEKVPVVVLRDKKEVTVMVTLGEPR
ncbi:M20/M25/M40 family metallo-hydrolase [Lignipirellula cremea]|uniref:Aminopeptidase S n=1 Tax=Lignipirellula cremea TaxID=2528010 RepID=A0A518DY41_9BACT|nr:M20/M25/M40 family metallo-hydrolase [Lignipirellula cremea]QDU96760.1 Aminopeptidase S [Lignipirellula cremea]